MAVLIWSRRFVAELPLSACSSVDADHSGTVEISELIAAVTHSLSGC